MKDKLLEIVKQINEKYRLIYSATGKNFNLLSIGKVDGKERFHQLLIADLLDPNGSHNQGNLFLHLFLKEIGYKKKIRSPKIEIEFLIDNNKKIDIVIKDMGKIALAIEMKVYAADSKNQLRDYWNFIKNVNDTAKLYFLTLMGEYAQDESNADVDYEVISFRKNIINWLDKCIKEVYYIPNLRDSLLIYKDLLEKMTHQNLQKEKEVASIISKDVESIKAATEISKGLERAWAEKEFHFWITLYQNVEEKISDKWEDGDEIIYKKKKNSVWYDQKGEILEEETIAKIQEIRFGKREEKHLGIAFKRNVANYKIYCILGYLNGDVCSWIGIQIKNKNNRFLSNEEIKKYFKGENFGLKEEDDISIYDCIDNLTFASKDTLNGTFELFDDKEHKRIVKKLTKRMVDLINNVDELLST